MSEKQILCIYHSADFDGEFCHQIAKKFLPENTCFWGWNFGDPPVEPTADYAQVYVLDLPCDRVLDLPAERLAGCTNLIWIDHHKSSIETHPKDIPGYRIDGVSACRLAWQWFTLRGVENHPAMLPHKQQYVERFVNEPLAVRLAGEYDIWDRRDPRAELFQHGLRSRELTSEIWDNMLGNTTENSITVDTLLEGGKVLQYARTKENESVIKEIGFTFAWEGLTFLACNAARYNSLLFTAGLKPEHDACFGFKWTGKEWSVSLYHAPGKEHHDLSVIAKKHGGGGHRGACGFMTKSLPFLT